MKQITLQESTITEAMGQIDALEGLNVKQQGCLRLLTEEMFSMVNELLGVGQLDYGITCEEKKYTLTVSTRARMSDETRKNFLSLSSDGRNAAHKGIMGVMRAMLEMFTAPDDSYIMPSILHDSAGLMETSHNYMWTLSETLERLPQKEKLNWDGMERSIIANFADDVSIGINSDKLQMTVTKLFA